ncbi:MAG: PIN domain-containing protein [Acidimicrobiia bacterium]
MTTLVDTSVWIDHFRVSSPRLAGLLDEALVVLHPFVVGELACGTLRGRDEVLGLLDRLAEAPVAEHREARGLLDAHRLWGQGLGWVDIHLLASCRLGSHDLWTLDRPLAAAAARLGVGGPDVT